MGQTVDAYQESVIDTAARARRAAIVAGALSFLTIAIFATLQWQDVRDNRWETQSFEASSGRQQRLRDYLGALQDIETGQRGYLVTGNVMFLEPFDNGRGKERQLEHQLVNAYPHGSDAERAAQALIAAGRAKLSLSSRVIGLRRSGQEQAAGSIDVERNGKQIMDRARQLVALLDRSDSFFGRELLVSAAQRRTLQQRKILLAEAALVLSLASLIGAMAQIIRALRRTSLDLAESAQRQTAILEAANDGMLILDSSGQIVSANRAAEQVLGHSNAEMVGKSNLILMADPPSKENSQHYLDGIARADGSAPTNVNFVGRRSNGETFETEVATTPLMLSGSQHFLAVARDTTERRRLERMKDEFVATVSHELRTPMTSIAGSLGLMVGGAAGHLPEKASRLAQIAHNNSQRLIRLINDILDLEKIEAGRMQFDPQSLQLHAYLPQTVEASSGLAATRGVHLDLKSIPIDAVIYADPDRMAQVLSNLLSNAIKYSPEGGTVTISTERQDAVQRISISDQGPGIAPEFHDRIFGKFAQADSSDTRAVGGTGLGLSIVKEIVIRSGGTISFDAERERGAVFHIDLPVPPDTSPSEFDRTKLAVPGDPNRVHVLHIDDDADTLRLVADALEEPFEVFSCPSLREAQAAFRRWTFNAVILDIQLSDGSGLDLVPEIRTSSEKCPIILYTAHDADAQQEKMVDAVLIKSRQGLEDLAQTVGRLTRMGD